MHRSLPRNVHRVMSGSGGTSQGGSTRCGELLGIVPLTTALLAVVNIGMYIAALAGDYERMVASMAISRIGVLYYGRWWTMITSAFAHGGLMHIAFNMMAFFQLGTALETSRGTLAFTYMVTLFVLTIGPLYIGIQCVLHAIQPDWGDTAAVGFSGVIFALAVVEATASTAPTRSLFGLVSVPTKVYPWVLMLLLQLLIPGVSFVGHLSGALLGFLFAAGLCTCLIPSNARWRRVEATACCQPMMRMRAFKLTPSTDVTSPGRGADARSQLGTCWSGTRWLLRPVTDIFAACWARVAPSRRAAPPSLPPRDSGSAPGRTLNSSSGGIQMVPSAMAPVLSAASSPSPVAPQSAAAAAALARFARAPGGGGTTPRTGAASPSRSAEASKKAAAAAAAAAAPTLQPVRASTPTVAILPPVAAPPAGAVAAARDDDSEPEAPGFVVSRGAAATSRDGYALLDNSQPTK